MNLPVMRWDTAKRIWISEMGGSYKIMKLPSQSQGSGQETITVGEGGTMCKNCGEMFEVWGTDKTTPPSYCSFSCMKQWLDYHIDNRNATPEEIKKKSSMSIPANSKLPIMRWEKDTRKWTIENKSASAA